MKKFLIIFCSFSFMITATVFAYNSDKGPAKQKEGLAEWPQDQRDSMMLRGKYLVDKMQCTDQDLQAVAEYLRNQ